MSGQVLPAAGARAGLGHRRDRNPDRRGGQAMGRDSSRARYTSLFGRLHAQQRHSALAAALQD